MSKQVTVGAPLAHGATRLPAVEVASYNVELKDDEGFIGDRARKGHFGNSSTIGASQCGRSARIPLAKSLRARSPESA